MAVISNLGNENIDFFAQSGAFVFPAFLFFLRSPKGW